MIPSWLCVLEVSWKWWYESSLDERASHPPHGLFKQEMTRLLAGRSHRILISNYQTLMLIKSIQLNDLCFILMTYKTILCALTFLCKEWNVKGIRKVRIKKKYEMKKHVKQSHAFQLQKKYNFTIDVRSDVKCIYSKSSSFPKHGQNSHAQVKSYTQCLLKTTDVLRLNSNFDKTFGVLELF